MNGTIQAPAKLKRTQRAYTTSDKAKALQLLADELPYRVISEKLGIPVTTLGTWATNCGLRRQAKDSFQARVKTSVNQAVSKVSNQITSRTQELIEDSLTFGKEVLNRAGVLVPGADEQSLANLANAGKVGVGIARQALGLNDNAERCIVRVDLLSSATQEKPMHEATVTSVTSVTE